jgi:erythromycin esterase-like protein
LRRELERVVALDKQLPVPTAFYEIRDEWMARSAAQLLAADGRRKIVVWMHNDHARYGKWAQGDVQIRATGQFLKQMFPDDVYSIGLLMGSGAFADNSRRERSVVEPPPGSIELLFAEAKNPVTLLRLSGSRNESLRRWAEAEHPYVRGTAVATMRLAAEFDALLYFDKVSARSSNSVCDA